MVEGKKMWRRKLFFVGCFFLFLLSIIVKTLFSWSGDFRVEFSSNFSKIKFGINWN